MPETIRQKIQSFSLFGFVALLCLAGWNAVAVKSQIAVSGSAPDVGQIAAVALPALGGIVSGIVSAIAFVVKLWKSKSSTTDLSVIPTNPQILTERLGYPIEGTVSLRWPGRTPFTAQWSGGEVEETTK